MGSTRLNGVMTYYFVGFGVTGWGLPFRTSGAALEPDGHGGMLRLCGVVSKNIPPRSPYTDTQHTCSTST